MIAQAVARTQKKCRLDYGYVSNPDLPLWTNTRLALLDMKAQRYFSLPTNLSFHNLCNTLSPPPGTASLLGLGQKYCIERSTPHYNFLKIIDRFRRPIRINYWLRDHAIPTREYIPQLYVPSGWDPGPVDLDTSDVEIRLMDFANDLEATAKARQRAPRHNNLSAQQYRTLHAIKNDRRFIVILSDKNLGPAIMEREDYKRRVLTDHLLNAKAYEQLTEASAKARMETTQQKLEVLLKQHERALSQGEQDYFDCSLDSKAKAKHRILQFYITAKVHKLPWGSRPVVACVASYNEVWSVWLDYRMKELLPLSRTYLRDSEQVLSELNALGRLTPNAKLFTADAVSMYTNIDTTHAISVFKEWFVQFPDETPQGFPTKLFLRVLEIIMTSNIFQFDDTYWVQTSGTAMGTSAACMYATLYYAFHERLTIIPKYQHRLLYLPKQDLDWRARCRMARVLPRPQQLRQTEVGSLSTF